MTKKYCRQCEENEPLKNRKFCLFCLNKQEREKKKQALAIKKLRVEVKKKKKKEKRENNTRLLKKKLDKVFSDYIRQRDKGICFTCGNKKDWQKQQNGHYISRGNYNTRYDEENCHCQCVACNIFKKGNYPAYSEALMNKYGVEIIGKLNKRAREVKQWTAQELKEMIQKYTCGQTT